MSSKFESVHRARFSPYTSSRTVRTGISVSNTVNTTKRNLEEKSTPIVRVNRRRHRSEPATDETVTLQKQHDSSAEDDIDRIYSSIKPPDLRPKPTGRLRTTTVSEYPYEIAPDVSNATTCHEEVNVNELAAYLENSVLIPRKMSSMAETIYG